MKEEGKGMWCHKGDKASSKNNPTKVGTHGWPDSGLSPALLKGFRNRGGKPSEVKAKV